MFKFLMSNWKDVGYLIGILALAGWTFYKEMKSRTIRKRLKLAPNPKLCGEHAVAIGKIDVKIINIEKDIDEIKVDVKKLREQMSNG